MRDSLRRMLDSLSGLSVGDAFGQRFFSAEITESCLGRRTPPPAPWHWTDDTNMALSIVEQLTRFGEIDPDRLAESFARRYDPSRGYGASMHTVLRRIGAGEHWATVTGEQFDGTGSYGNGAAMRAAPLGAFFADDLDRVVEQAEIASRVSHAHPEALAGGIAVAVASALAAQSRGSDAPRFQSFLGEVASRLPKGTSIRGLVRRAQQMEEASPPQAVAALGNGSQISAQDTVPLTLWIAAKHLDDFVEALWTTAQAGGDVDTTCAIVGGVLAARTGANRIPTAWIKAREPLPAWASPDIQDPPA